MRPDKHIHQVSNFLKDAIFSSLSGFSPNDNTSFFLLIALFRTPPLATIARKAHRHYQIIIFALLAKSLVARLQMREREIFHFAQYGNHTMN